MLGTAVLGLHYLSPQVRPTEPDETIRYRPSRCISRAMVSLVQSHKRNWYTSANQLYSASPNMLNSAELLLHHYHPFRPCTMIGGRVPRVRVNAVLV